MEAWCAKSHTNIFIYLTYARTEPIEGLLKIKELRCKKTYEGSHYQEIRGA